MAAAIERQLTRCSMDDAAADRRHARRPATGACCSPRIARGVIEHLKAHPEAFEVVFTAVPSNRTTVAVRGARPGEGGRHPMSEPAYLDVPFHLGGARAHGDDRRRRPRPRPDPAGAASPRPGERVNRPDFGCGLKAMVFAPGGEALAAATQVLVKGALQKWLQDEIEVQDVVVEAIESTLDVTVVYRRRARRRAARGALRAVDERRRSPTAASTSAARRCSQSAATARADAGC